MEQGLRVSLTVEQGPQILGPGQASKRRGVEQSGFTLVSLCWFLLDLGAGVGSYHKPCGHQTKSSLLSKWQLCQWDWGSGWVR